LRFAEKQLRRNSKQKRRHPRYCVFEIINARDYRYLGSACTLLGFFIFPLVLNGNVYDHHLSARAKLHSTLCVSRKCWFQRPSASSVSPWELASGHYWWRPLFNGIRDALLLACISHLLGVWSLRSTGPSPTTAISFGTSSRCCGKKHGCDSVWAIGLNCVG